MCPSRPVPTVLTTSSTAYPSPPVASWSPGRLSRLRFVCLAPQRHLSPAPDRLRPAANQRWQCKVYRVSTAPLPPSVTARHAHKPSDSWWPRCTCAASATRPWPKCWFCWAGGVGATALWRDVQAVAPAPAPDPRAPCPRTLDHYAACAAPGESRLRAQEPVPDHRDHHPSQPRPPSFLHALRRTGQTQEGGSRGRHAQAAHRSERCEPGPDPLANGTIVNDDPYCVRLTARNQFQRA